MTKYLINRILRSLLSVVIVVGVIMTMIYSFLDKQSIFATDPVFTKQKSNAKQVYMMQQWEQFGYLDYVAFADYLLEEQKAGNKEFDSAALQTWESMKAMNRPELDWFLDFCLGAFKLNLDQL